MSAYEPAKGLHAAGYPAGAPSAPVGTAAPHSGRPTASLVAGEEELGPQRRCRDCGEWWPLDEEFFYRFRYTDTGRVVWSGQCRACWRIRRRAS